MAYPQQPTGTSGLTPSPTFPEIEKAVLAYWAEHDTFTQSVERREAGESAAELAGALTGAVAGAVEDGARGPLGGVAQHPHTRQHRARDTRCHNGRHHTFQEDDL